jgi:hypothetical protein
MRWRGFRPCALHACVPVCPARPRTPLSAAPTAAAATPAPSVVMLPPTIRRGAHTVTTSLRRRADSTLHGEQVSARQAPPSKPRTCMLPHPLQCPARPPATDTARTSSSITGPPSQPSFSHCAATFARFAGAAAPVGARLAGLLETGCGGGRAAGRPLRS